MVQSHRYHPIVLLTLAVLFSACQSPDQDRADRRRALAQQTCEDAVRDQLSSRATARFSSDNEHVFYDSTGGAGVTGVVAADARQRNFACILSSETDSTWTLTAARLMN